MNKIIVIGCPGAGKSCFSRKLNEITAIPLYYLDCMFWKENWEHITTEELLEKQSAIFPKEKWIIDGNYGKTLEARFKACDTVFFLNIDENTCIESEEKRRGTKRDDLPSFLEEKYDPEFIQYIKDFKNDYLPLIHDLINKYKDKEYHIFNTREESELFLKELDKKVHSICQCCSMPMDDSLRGTNADGSLSKDYCKYCLKDGKFIHNVSLDEYIEMNVPFYEQAGMKNEQEMRDYCSSKFPTLKRWQLENIKLVKLNKDNYPLLVEMLDEWVEYNHVHENANHSPSAIFKADHHDFKAYMDKINQIENGLWGVPTSIYFALDTKRKIFVGAIHIRHELNESLALTGGHIGDGVRPSERRKGIATKIIQLGLEECKKLGIDKVLMTVDKDNYGSKKSIIANGGIYESDIVDEDGVIEERYWINL